MDDRFRIIRATGDLDLWAEPTEQNADRIMMALTRFEAPLESLGIRREDFTTSDVGAQLGLPQRRIDLLTTVSGIDFDSAWVAKVEALIEGAPVFVIGRAHLIRNKLATGRPKDRIDAESLGRFDGATERLNRTGLAIVCSCW